MTPSNLDSKNFSEWSFLKNHSSSWKPSFSRWVFPGQYCVFRVLCIPRQLHLSIFLPPLLLTILNLVLSIFGNTTIYGYVALKCLPPPLLPPPPPLPLSQLEPKSIMKRRPETLRQRNPPPRLRRAAAFPLARRDRLEEGRSYECPSTCIPSDHRNVTI